MTEERRNAMTSFAGYLSVALALAAQAGAAIWWAGQMNSRLTYIERHLADLDARQPGLATDVSKALTALAVTEERFRRLDATIMRLEQAIERIEQTTRRTTP